jgi:hypothetical protein
MDMPVRISFGANPLTLAMEMAMEWNPWFNGPRIQHDRMIFALRADYSGVDLLINRYKDEGKIVDIVLCYATGEELPPTARYCAWMPAPAETPKYPGVEQKITASRRKA